MTEFAGYALLGFSTGLIMHLLGFSLTVAINAVKSMTGQ